MLNKAFSLATVAAVIVLAAASEPATLPSYQGALLLQAGNDAGKCLRADNTNGAPVELTTCGNDQDLG